MEILTIPGGIPFRDRWGAERATVECRIVIADFAEVRRLGPAATAADAASLDPRLEDPLHRAIARRIERHGDIVSPFSVTVAEEAGVRLGFVAIPDEAEAARLVRMLESRAGAGAAIDPAFAAALIKWHEIGHIIEPSRAVRDNPDLYLRRRVEGWCDGLGAGVAHAVTRDAASGHAWAALRDRHMRQWSAAGNERALIYDIGDVTRAVLALGFRDPADMTSILRGVGEAADGAAPGAEVFRERYAALRDHRERLGDNCLTILNDRWAKIRLDLVVEKRLDEAAIARQIREQFAVNRGIQPPRSDLPGGDVATRALRMAMLAQNAAIANTTARRARGSAPRGVDRD